MASYEKAETDMETWLKDPTIPYSSFKTNMKSFKCMSYCSPITDKNIAVHDGKVHYISQFYIPTHKERAKEILNCLKLVVANETIDEVHLLNECIYTNKELGVTSDKIKQTNIKDRLKYSAIFDYIENKSLEGYIIIANSDIFFDGHLDNIKKSNLHCDKKIYCQLRVEYDGKSSLTDCKLFGPRQDSQDVWIYHSNNNIQKKHRKVFDFCMGKPGCDNKIAYLFTILGLKCYNEPWWIRCYHYHITQERTYTSQETIPEPYVSIIPGGVRNIKSRKPRTLHNFNIMDENTYMREYIQTQLETDEPFIIPRIAGIENNYAMIGVVIQQNKLADNNREYITRTANIMKTNAGIQINSVDDISKYASLYLAAFDKCKIYFDWEPWGAVTESISHSYNFIIENFKQPRIWSVALDIYHSIHSNPWTTALKGKRILIISPFIESMKKKLPVLSEIYGVDLFPECSFVFLKPPQTQGVNPSRNFDVELNEFCDKIEAIKDTFDIALCSCGGYGNLVCSRIFDMGKSAIYVGGVLQMYFGIYGQRWLRERRDIIRLYLNKHWSRPEEDERPKNYKKIEASCYW